MSEFISCFACDKEPTQQCPRCGRPYCDDHGEELCDACLEPASGVPSFTLYRGSLLALLFGTLLAVWLLIQPPDSSDDIRPQVVPTQQASANGTVQPGTTPQVNTSPAPGTTPQTNATAATTQAAGPTATRPAASTTPATGTTPAAGGGTYTVASGDTLGSICSARKPASMSLADCLDQVVSLNSLGSQNANLSIGQTLRIPQ